LPGQWTVSDVVQVYGKNAVDKLGHYFKKAKVAYPPREVTLIAYKQEKKLELWARGNGEFRFIRDYFIMAASGDTGPKLRQGDRQVPEGVYRITDLNPNSHYHLSMKLNYPNEFDIYHAELDGRTDLGSDIFIHGKDASIGCLAVGDAAIRELFVLTAQVGVANVKVVIAPHDPRIYPLVVNSEELPPWISELYAMISREIEAVSHKAKPSQSRL
jgi:murein L,D-transpeptidase YafK